MTQNKWRCMETRTPQSKNMHKSSVTIRRWGDQALFRTAILYAQPKAGKSDYQKSLDVFQTMLERYPQSSLKEEAGVMVALIKELRKAQQQTDAWEKKAETLKQRIEKMKKIDQDIELKKRRLRPVR